MVMELVEGDCLSDITREGRPIPAHRAMEIARQVVLALSTAHRLGVIHRDVKPGNVMLDADGAVKVADFGIARAWNHATELTQTGSVIGTATYFSPEQAQGRPGRHALRHLFPGGGPLRDAGGATSLPGGDSHVRGLPARFHRGGAPFILATPRSPRSWMPSCCGRSAKILTADTRTPSPYCKIWRRG